MSEYDEFLELYRDGKSMDEILAEMKKRGLTIIHAIRATTRIFGVGLGDAKSIVASHPSWVQTAEASIPLHDEIIKVFQESGDSDDPESAQSLN